ncbi:RNA polymerase sigma factor [Frigoribacterium sp. VKM Ac-2530]|uniref:RNA polymerase sigma factor n=1 Tax=Frigoribacterium sp. VKM Ac-2530 TaxID=2783822 RepID=UPI00188C5021|nr:sigma-70 family RNA polymerase sigma factor [Frigoribacterium sp. VKM Ac-2530]MBF4579126.1 sigma-70 family RNA polymerase sigma factor [Frigoribacterium sp. VKM Ac-2530]
MPPFDRVVERHGTTVLRVCRALLDPTDADDAWSETFLAALVAWPDLPSDVNVEAWLVTVARRKALDVIRARGRRPQPVEHLPEPEPGSASSAAFDEVLARDDALLRAVRSLPEGQRDAVVLHHLAGLSHLEVAELTGRSHAACRRSAADGVAALRRVLGEHDERGSTPTRPTGATDIRPGAPRRARPREGARR